MQPLSSAPNHTPTVDAPICPSCRTTMWLSRIEPDIADHDRRVFECQQCGREQSVVCKFK